MPPRRQPRVIIGNRAGHGRTRANPGGNAPWGGNPTRGPGVGGVQQPVNNPAVQTTREDVEMFISHFEITTERRYIMKHDKIRDEMRDSGLGAKRRCEWVLGLVERGTNRCVLIPIIRKTIEELYPLILRSVLPGRLKVN